MNWLGFKIDLEYKPESNPVYLQITLDDIELHLSGHYGNSPPNAQIFIDNFSN